MILDGISLIEGSFFSNATIASGSSFPENGSSGELFYKAGEGLFVHDGSVWGRVSSAAETLTVPGSNTQILFNDETALGAATQLTYSKATGAVNYSGIEIGYRVLPRVTTFNAAALGKRVALSAGVTIPASTYAAGDAFSFYNNTAAAVTITQGSGLTLRLDGTATTGNRTLALRGTCFVWFNSATEAIISGSVT
jgi:hypothetical protein